MLLETFIFYICLSSIVFIYGLGFNELLSTRVKPQKFLLHSIRLLFVTIISILIIWPITTYVLIPAKIGDLYPFFAIFIVSFLSTLFSFIVSKKNISVGIPDFVLSFLTVLLSMNESFSLLSALMIALLTICLFYIVIIGLGVFTNRISHSNPLFSFNYGSLLLLTIAFILLILFSTNISWLNY